MLTIMDKFTTKELVIICMMVRLNSASYKQMHRGLLPFLRIRHAIACFTMANNHSRLSNTIMAKLCQYSPESVKSGTSKFLMSLKDNLVAKHFGSHPERGVPLPSRAPIIHRKRKRKMFERKVDALDTQRVMISLNCVAHNLWEITVPTAYRPELELWLMDRCT